MPLDFSRKPKGFNTVSKKREYEELAATLLTRAEQVCRHLYPVGRKEGDEWCVGSPLGERGKSFKVNTRKGVACDFNGGEVVAGDMIGVWALAKGVKQSEAYDEASAWLGLDTGAPKTTPPWASTLAPVVAVAQDERWWRDRKPTTSWDYIDADGVVWATVNRWDDPIHGKHVQPSGPLPGGPRPVYNLPSIMRSTGPVILVEGEKCAERLIKLGHVATTAIGGASGVGKTDWSPLAGRDVIRWADNDKAGEKWLETTRECLSQIGVKSVRDVAIPAGKPDKWDCADASDREIGVLLDAARNGGPDFEGGVRMDAKRPITAKPLALPPFADIPKRRFVYDTIYQRGTVTVTAGEGGSGKSALHVVEAICIATGRDLLETGKPIERCRVWMIALEDDETEMHRRIAAALMHFNVDRSEVEGWLFVTTRSDAPKFLLAASTSDGVVISDDAVASMKAEIVEHDIGAVTVDPYVYVHSINENDNMGQAAVMQALVEVVSATDVALALVHHAKKPAANDRGGPSAGDIRGASAIVNSARHGRLVNTMSAADADKLGVPRGERYYYFRTTSVKANYSPKADSGRWFKMHGVRLPNGALDEEGDGVGVVTRWKAPDPFKVMGVTVDTLRAAQTEIDRAFRAGTPYRASPKAEPWVGEVIGNEVGLDTKDKNDKGKIAKILATWIGSGALVEDRTWSDGHQKRPIVRSGPPAVNE